MSKNGMSESKLLAVIDWAYDRAIDGVPGAESAERLAEDYLAKAALPREAANSLIRWQNTKAGTSGFVTGLGGILTMPVAVPANIASVLYVQLRMIAAIAHMGGYDVRDDRVRTLAYVCLCGNSAKDILKQSGIVVGTKFTQAALKRVPGKVLIEINKKVGFRLLTKFGEKGAINLHKAIPVVGGLIGAAFDAVATNSIGNTARETFLAA